jgi:hypothetical protein
MNNATDSLGRKYEEAVATARKSSATHNHVVVVGRLHSTDGEWVWKVYGATGPSSRAAHQELRDDGKRWEPVIEIRRERRW